MKLLTKLTAIVLFSSPIFVGYTYADDEVYFTLDASPTLFVAVTDDPEDLDDISVNIGIGGTGSACYSTSHILDLCAGLSAYVGKGEVHVTVAEMGDEPETSLEYASSAKSIGAFGQAKLKAGSFTIAPFAGIQRTFMTVDVPTVGSQDSAFNSAFVGLETTYALFNGQGEIGLRGQFGRSLQQSNGSHVGHGSIGAVFKANFN